MDGAVRASVKAAARIIRANAPEALGDLKRSVEIEGNEVVVNAPYAVAVEVGSRPHTPPFAPLKKWAEAIGVSNPGAVAKAVQMKIAAEGTKPRWFVRGSIPQIMQATGASVRYVLKK